MKQLKEYKKPHKNNYWHYSYEEIVRKSKDMTDAEKKSAIAKNKGHIISKF